MAGKAENRRRKQRERRAACRQRRRVATMERALYVGARLLGPLVLDVTGMDLSAMIADTSGGYLVPEGFSHAISGDVRI